MAEAFSAPLPERTAQAAELERETHVSQLVEFVRYNVYRKETQDRHDEILDIFRQALGNLLKELNVHQYDHIIEHVEDRLRKGQHDLVIEFLANLNKLQHDDFAQEFLRLQAVPIPVAADDWQAGVTLMADEDAQRLGHAAIASFDEN